MPVLDDPRHEKFVFELVVNSANQTDAYINAGFKVKDRNVARASAARLLTKDSIRARRAEMLTELQARKELKAELRAIDRRENEVLTLEAHMANLLTLRDKAIEEGKIDAAIKAEVKRGELRKFYIKQVEHGGVGEFDDMNAEQLREHIRLRIETSGGSLSTAGPSRGTGSARGKPH